MDYKMSVSEALDHLSQSEQDQHEIAWLQAKSVIADALKLGGFEVYKHDPKQAEKIAKYLHALSIPIKYVIYADTETASLRLSNESFESTISTLKSKLNTICKVSKVGKTEDGDVASFYLDVMGYSLGSIHVIRDQYMTYIRLHNAPKDSEGEFTKQEKEELMQYAVEEQKQHLSDLHKELYGTPDNPRTKKYPVM